MSPRRSARISSAIKDEKEDTKPTTNGATPPKVANISKKRKVAPEIAEPSTNGSPSTPKRKKASKPLPPITPTPSAISLMSMPYSSGDINDSTPPPINRLAIPNGTNAALVTPETHRLVASKPVDQVSPSKKAGIKTTSNLLDEAHAHLIKVDPKLKPIIEKHRCHVFSPEGLAEEIDPFRSLASGIISQQVSGAAAKSIKAKFVALFNADKPDAALHIFPTPSQVCGSSIEVLRTAGLSQRKAEYILGLAEKFHSKELTTEILFNASYEEVLESLIKVRGLGKWSVEMFACFGLKRLDVFSTGDLGVQRGMAAFIGKDVSKLKGKGGKWKYMSEKEMEEMAEKFKPYRSIFMWLMWRVEEVDISTLEG
ncbi:related to MAG1-3-methyladenine DNA glycosylase [Phialocephala subalpina]|uniref:Related to MAG1-3-methyladenine DNA glycosylase n=1 Tax=Phialocephala subalpina TaxID=576137 RepID=A0A1L7X3Y2_9HELO|nr:related to MAG1-3-methyladenine DNA glycosylase [Phialocephala subalpina]